MGTNLLTTRLAQLAEAGLIEKVAPQGGHAHYQLTPAGRSLEESVMALIRWGMQFPEQRQGKPQSRREWDILPLRAYFDTEKAAQWRGSYCLLLEGERYLLACEDNQLVLQEEADHQPPLATIEMTLEQALAISTATSVAARRKLEHKLAFTGHKTDVQRFLAAFS